MKKLAIVLGLLLCGSFANPVKADPYRWCAVYGGGEGGFENCYFVTFEQCRASLAGGIDFCRVNTFYTGSDQRQPRRRAR